VASADPLATREAPPFRAFHVGRVPLGVLVATTKQDCRSTGRGEPNGGRPELPRQLAQRTAAIASERERIGGELQDIIAHSVSVMVIQAGSARLLLRREPDRARASILNVEHRT
jgi:signal transduction histidine kinase